MDILNRVYQNKLCCLKDFLIEHCVINNSDNEIITDNLKNVLFFIDQKKYPERNKMNCNCSVTWAEMKDALIFTHLGKDLNLNHVPFATKKVNQQLHSYSSSTSLLHLFYNDTWKDLYNLIGTEYMKLILFQSSLFLPLSNNSYVALHKERTLRVLNSFTKSIAKSLKCKKFVPNRIKQFSSVINSCVKNDQYCNVEVISMKKKLDKKNTGSKYGYNGSMLLSLHGLMYNRSGLKNFHDTDNMNNNTNYDKNCEYLLGIILEQDVGVIMSHSYGDLSQFKLFLKHFIKKSLVLGKSRDVMNSILEAQCTSDQMEVNSRKRKKPLEIQRSVKKRRLSQSSLRFNMATKGRRKKPRLHSVDPISLSEVRKLIAFVMRKLLPKKFFGSQISHIINNFSHILKYGKNQVFEFSHLMKNIDITKIHVLKNIKSVAHKWNLLAKFFLWLLIRFLFPVLCKHFYVTESRWSFNKLQYYNKKHWQILKCCVIYNFLNSGRWIILTKQLKKISDVMNLTPCHVRFLPKKKFRVRPILWRKGYGCYK